MKLCCSLAVVYVLTLVFSTVGQTPATKSVPYIEFFGCDGCNERLVTPPNPVYPAMVGYGAHKYDGNVIVQVEIDENGDVYSATAISGHPFFRPNLERASKKLKFAPLEFKGTKYPSTVTVTFRVVSTLAGVLPILNSTAIRLPKPTDPPEAEQACANGRVEVEVLAARDGSILKADAIRGEPKLYESAVAAAKNAKLKFHDHAPSKEFRGKLVYNFDSPAKCITRGVLNEKALSIPRPILGSIVHPKHLQIRRDSVIDVQVVVDVTTGRVTYANTDSGHPLVRSAFEDSARKARFVTTTHSENVRVKGIIRYVLKTDGEVLF